MSESVTTIKVLYSCRGCDLEKVPVAVPERVASEDLIAWLEKVKQQIANDHIQRSPQCDSDCCDLMIPITGTDRVGGAARQ